MKLLVIGAVLGATLLGALPAMAQMTVRAGPNGVVVRDSGDRGYNRGYDRDRSRYRYRSHRASCRTVTTRRHRANGSVVVTTRRVC